MKAILTFCALVLAFGCTPPITAIKRAQTATIVVSTAHFYSDNTDEMIKAEIEKQLSLKLSQHVKLIKQADATDDTIEIRIRFIKPALAEVPHWSENLASNLMQNVTGHLSDDFYQGFLQLGVTITPEQRTQIEDDPLEWGLFPKTAKRHLIKSLGYTPYLISGKVNISSKSYNRDCGTFFGWNSLKYMKPLQKMTQHADDIIIKASCDGVVEYIYSKKIQ